MWQNPCEIFHSCMLLSSSIVVTSKQIQVVACKHTGQDRQRAPQSRLAVLQ